MSNDPCLPLGMTDDGKLVTDPYPGSSRLVIGPSGSNKTTSVVMPTAQALIGYPDIATIIADPKDGEAYCQLLPAAKKFGRRFACIDDFGVYGFDNPRRISISAFGSVVATAKHAPHELVFALQTATLGIIPEVDDGGRNFYFRETPRQELHLGLLCIAEFLALS